LSDPLGAFRPSAEVIAEATKPQKSQLSLATVTIQRVGNGWAGSIVAGRGGGFFSKKAKPRTFTADSYSKLMADITLSGMRGFGLIPSTNPAPTQQPVVNQPVAAPAPTLAPPLAVQTAAVQASARMCQGCGAIVPENMKFCGSCGKKYEPPAPPPPPPAPAKTFCGSCGNTLTGTKFCTSCGERV
jgi:hypothetical protein